MQLAGQALDKFVTKVSDFFSKSSCQQLVITRAELQASSTLVQGDVPRFGSAPGELRREDLYILQLDVYGSTTQIIVGYIERAHPSRIAQATAVPSSSLPSVTHTSYGLPASAGQAQYSLSGASQAFVPQPQARTARGSGPYATTSSPERQNLHRIYTQPAPTAYPPGWPTHHASTASAAFVQSNQSVRDSVGAGQPGPASSFVIAGQSGGGRHGPSASSGTGNATAPNGLFLATATSGASTAAAQQLAYNGLVYQR